MNPMYYILIGVVALVVAIDFYLKKKNKKSKNTDLIKYKKTKSSFTRLILFGTGLILLIISCIYVPKYVYKDVCNNFNEENYQKVINTIEKNRIVNLIAKNNNDIKKIYFLAKIHQNDLNNFYATFDLDFNESVDILKYLLFKYQNGSSFSGVIFYNSNQWSQILNLANQIKSKFPTLSEENVFIDIGLKVFYFNKSPWYLSFSEDVKDEVLDYMNKDEQNIFNGNDQNRLYELHLEFYDDFYKKYNYKYSQLFNLVGLWDLLIESSVICSNPNTPYYWVFNLDHNSKKYLDRLIFHRKELIDDKRRILESNEYELNTAYFENILANKNEASIKDGFSEKNPQIFVPYGFLATYYNDQDDYEMANRYINKAIQSANTYGRWNEEADYKYSKFIINWNILPFGDKNGACSALEDAYELWLENEDPDATQLSKISKESILDALKATCRKY